MPHLLRSSSITPKVDPEAWKKKFTGTSTRSRTSYNEFKNGDHQFLRIQDNPTRGRKRPRSFDSPSPQILSDPDTPAVTHEVRVCISGLQQRQPDRPPRDLRALPSDSSFLTLLNNGVQPQDSIVEPAKGSRYATQEFKIIAPREVIDLTANSDDEEQQQPRKKIVSLTASKDFARSKKPGQQNNEQSYPNPSPSSRFGGPGRFGDNTSGDVEKVIIDTTAATSSVPNNGDVAAAIKPIKRVTNLIELPLEIRQSIVLFLEEDKSIIAMAMTCRKLWDTLTDIIWYKRAKDLFDPLCDGLNIFQQAQTYKTRQSYLRGDLISFKDGRLSSEGERFLTILQDLIVESRPPVLSHRRPGLGGKNQVYIRKMVKQHFPSANPSQGADILEALCDTEHFNNPQMSQRKKTSRSRSSRIMLIQLCLAHLILDFEMAGPGHRGFRISQRVVYQDPSKYPIFLGRNKDEINLIFLSHVLNFVRFHLTQDKSEGVMTSSFENLGVCQRPSAGHGSRIPCETLELGKCWKGAWTYINPVATRVYRENNPNEDDFIFDDEYTEGNDHFQNLTLYFDIPEGANDHQLLHIPITYGIPESFGKPYGPMRDHVTKAKYSPDVKEFFGVGYNGEDYHLTGRVHAIPPQQKIPGFQRVSMVTHTGTDHIPWCYEGVVLPGGNIMLGRWWSLLQPHGEQEAGPFIFWRVLETPNDMMMDAAVAVKKIESLYEN